jgi:hypothetical protein
VGNNSTWICNIYNDLGIWSIKMNEAEKKQVGIVPNVKEMTDGALIALSSIKSKLTEKEKKQDD